MKLWLLSETLEAPEDDDEFGYRPSFFRLALGVVRAITIALNNGRLKLRNITNETIAELAFKLYLQHIAPEIRGDFDFEVTKRKPSYSTAKGFFLKGFFLKVTQYQEEEDQPPSVSGNVVFDINFGRDLDNEWYASRVE